jgi:hypothetical protein
MQKSDCFDAFKKLRKPHNYNIILSRLLLTGRENLLKFPALVNAL